MSGSGNLPQRLVMLGDYPLEKLLSFHRGRVDAQNGQWARAYESMSVGCQAEYANGRLTVLNVMRSDPVPIWRGDRETARGPVSAAWARSVDRTGNPLP